ncbi:MAG TPA: amino acid adenylation domain-containing protein, partial [Herpetosiphonaceae bacterium]
TIARMSGHFLRLVAAVVADGAQPVATLPLLTEAEVAQFTAWNATAVPVPQDLTVVQRFEVQVARTPDATALIVESTTLSYTELNRRANQLARCLRKRGLGPEDRVGLCVERSVEMVVGILGVLKAGAAYVPLDPAYPPERLRFMCDDAGVALVLTQNRLLARLDLDAPEQQADVVCLDADWPAIAQESAEDLSPVAGPHDLAYLIYTSGTSGTPKAVQVEHRQLANVLHASQHTFAVQPGDVLPALASFAFDIALFELFLPLLVGGTVRLLTREAIMDTALLLPILDQCSLVHTVPSLMRQIVRTASAQQRQIASIRRIFIGGDAVPPDLLRQLPAVFPQAQITVLYGPTEATIICAAYTVPAAAVPERQLIGRPLPNMQLHIYDAQQRLVPIGVPGELYVAGAGVTRGYLNREALTAEKFVTIDGARHYRTGDLVRYLPDGTIEFLGRIDDQVKVRGFRIELGEIEAVLRQHPAVADAVVLVHDERLPSGEVDQRLLGYVVAGARDDAAFLEAGQVAEWQQLFDTAYTPTDAAVDPRFNLSGWNSSYTGQPLPA